MERDPFITPEANSLQDQTHQTQTVDQSNVSCVLEDDQSEEYESEKQSPLLCRNPVTSPLSIRRRH